MPPTITGRQPKSKITVTLDSDLVRQIDDLLGSPETRQRSRLVEEALRTWLAERARKETERQVEEYYRSLSEAERKEDALANDVIVVRLSTTLRPAPTHVELPAGEGGLKHASMAKCEQVTTLDKSFLLRGPFAGTIRPSCMREVEKAIQRAIGILVL